MSFSLSVPSTNSIAPPRKRSPVPPPKPKELRSQRCSNTATAVQDQQVSARTSWPGPGHVYPNVATGGNSSNVLGDVHHHHHYVAASGVQPIEDGSSVDEAVATLVQASERDFFKDSGLRRLANHLHDSNLALSLAGAFLSQCSESCATYLEMHEAKLADTIAVTLKQLTRSEQRAVLLGVTLTLTIERLESKHDDAANLFAALAFFSNDHIYYDLINATKYPRPPHLNRVTISRVYYDQAIWVLQKYALVRTENDCMRIDASVASWNALRCSKSREFVSNYMLATHCIADAQAARSKGHYVWHTSLVHHAEHLTSPIFSDFRQQCSSNKSFLLSSCVLARVLHNANHSEKAKAVLRQTLVAQQAVLGPTHDQTIITASTLGRTHRDLSEFSKAEEVLTDVLKTLGGDTRRPAAIRIMVDLFSVYRCSDNITAAANILNQACEALGTCEQQMQLTMDWKDAKWSVLLQVAHHYTHVNDAETAEACYKQALEYGFEVFGHNSFVGPTIWVPLGRLYREQRKFVQAQQCFEAALDAEVRLHPNDVGEAYRLARTLDEIYLENGDNAKSAQLRTQWDLPPAIPPRS